jgi:ANTAR domain/GAF domain
VKSPDDAHGVGAAQDAGPWTTARLAIDDAAADQGIAGLAADLQRVCRAAASSLSLVGAVVLVITGPCDAVVLSSSDPRSRRFGELPFEVGEGPSLAALSLARPVLVPALGDGSSASWPGYASAAGAAGVRAVYAIPLHVGAVRLGVLELYGAATRALTSAELSLALVFARAATDSLVDSPAGSSGVPVTDQWMAALERRVEVHQAQGMVAVDLGLGLADAIALMRANSFTLGVSLLELARRVIAGERLPLTGAP